MKVVIIHTPLTTSTGGSRQILKLAIELQKMGHQVKIFTNEIDYEKCFPEMLSQVDIKTVPYMNRFRKLGYYNLFIGMLKISKEVIREKADVINNHNFPTEWAIYFVKKKINIPTVWMCNEPPFWFFQPEARKGLNKVFWPLFEVLDKISVDSIDKIVVLSKLMGDIVRKTYRKDYTVIRSGHKKRYRHRGLRRNLRRGV